MIDEAKEQFASHKSDLPTIWIDMSAIAADFPKRGNSGEG